MIGCSLPGDWGENPTPNSTERTPGPPHPASRRMPTTFYNEEAISHLTAKVPLLLYQSPPRIGLWLFRFILFLLLSILYAEGLLDTNPYVCSFGRSRIPSAPRLMGLSNVTPMPAFMLDNCLSLHLPRQASALAHVPSLHRHPPLGSLPPVMNTNQLFGSKDHPVLYCQSALAHPRLQELPV